MISSKTKRYCCEDISLIENYKEAIEDKNNIWQCHHRLETHTSDGERRLADISVKELETLGVYYNRPASELILLPITEHRRLHMIGNKPHITEEMKKLLSEIGKSRTGNKNPNYGKYHKVSEETKNKLRNSFTEERRRNISKGVTKRNSGRKWFNNGFKNVFTYECPEGYFEGMLKRTNGGDN